jgi:hypothetical protein
MLAPAREYQERVAEARTGRWPRAFVTPLLVTLILGIVTAVAGVGRVTASLVISGAICWSFVVILQLLTGIALIASVPSRQVDLPRSVELLFDSHGPWSLWLVGIGFLHSTAVSQMIMAGSALVPFAWTARILQRYGEEVLGLPRKQAVTRVLAHQAITALLIVMYVELATGLSLRILGVLQS